MDTLQKITKELRLDVLEMTSSGAPGYEVVETDRRDVAEQEHKSFYYFR
ncbi:MAG: hypothetical protein ACUVWJ_07275 [Spirochaetota bacterium]